MTIMDDEDLAEIRTVFDEIIDDRPVTIIIRRGEDELDSQTVRIARTKSGARFRGEASKETRGGVVVCGAPEMDVELDDRFTLEGQVYRVTFVRPNRDAGTQAEADLVQ